MEEIEAFDGGLKGAEREICVDLHSLIAGHLPGSSQKMFHGSPVWFLRDNPIVGYSIKKEGVALLFWSGQGFATGGLRAVGKHKAAEAVYRTRAEIDRARVLAWLGESTAVQWNYRDIVKNQGKLELLQL